MAAKSDSDVVVGAMLKFSACGNAAARKNSKKLSKGVLFDSGFSATEIYHSRKEKSRNFL
jgi:hypothetical protein